MCGSSPKGCCVNIYLMIGSAKCLVERTGLSLKLEGVAVKAPYLRVACSH